MVRPLDPTSPGRLIIDGARGSIVVGTVNTPTSRINLAYMATQPKVETVTGKELTTAAVKAAHGTKMQTLVRHGHAVRTQWATQI